MSDRGLHVRMTKRGVMFGGFRVWVVGAAAISASCGLGCYAECSGSGEASWDFSGVSGSDRGEVYFVGHRTPGGCGEGGAQSVGVVARFEGRSWEALHESSDLAEASAVWATASEVFVAAGSGVVHYRAGEWETRRLEDVADARFHSIAGLSSAEVFVVGSQGAGESRRGLIAHYDGERLVEVDARGLPVLFDLWLDETGEGYAVGSRGTVVKRDRSGTWSRMESGTGQELLAVWGSSPKDVYVVTDAAGSDRAILHYDGEGWSGMQIPEEIYVSDIWGRAPSDVYAVGRATGGEALAIVLHYNGNVWQREGVPTGTHGLTSVWVGSEGEYVAVGSGETTVRGSSR